MGDDGGKALVYQAYRHRRQPGRQSFGERPGLHRGGAFPPGKPSGQPDDDFDRVLVSGERGQALQVAWAPADGGERAGQQPVRIAPCHADPGRSDVDREPGSEPQPPPPCTVVLTSTEGPIGTTGLIGATIWLQHGLTLAH